MEESAGYVVDLDDIEGTERIDADRLEPCTDLRWPRRPRGTLKDGPPPGLLDPLPPRLTCAEDLEEILDRAINDRWFSKKHKAFGGKVQFLSAPDGTPL